MIPVMTNAHKECRGQIAGCDAGKCRTYDVYLDMLLGRLSRALDQQPRTRRPSGKHRESSTLELAAEHGRHGAFVSCRVWLRFAYNGTGRRVVKDGPHIQDYLPWTPSMNVAIDDQRTLSCKNFSLAPAVSVLLGQKIFTGQNGNKSSCGTSGTLTAAGRKGFRELTFLRDKCFQRH